MRKLYGVAMVALLAAVFTSTAVAKTHSFTVASDSAAANIQLEKGRYKIEIDGNQATIIQRNVVIGQVQVEVRKAKVQNPGTVLLAADGTIKEIRLKNQVVTIVR